MRDDLDAVTLCRLPRDPHSSRGSARPHRWRSLEEPGDLGRLSAASQALHVLDLWGAACWVGLGSTIHFDLTEHLYKQITGMSSWTTSKSGMADCAKFVVERQVDVDALFTERWKLDDGARAYEVFDQQTSGKAVFMP